MDYLGLKIGVLGDKKALDLAVDWRHVSFSPTCGWQWETLPMKAIEDMCM